MKATNDRQQQPPKADQVKYLCIYGEDVEHRSIVLNLKVLRLDVLEFRFPFKFKKVTRNIHCRVLQHLQIGLVWK